MSAMSSQVDALVRLFRDDDPSTVGLVKEQLLLRGEEALPDLRDLLNADSAIVAAHAQEVLHQIAGKKATSRLEAILGDSEDPDWEQVSILISAALMPWVEPEDLVSTLDEWGVGLTRRLTSSEGYPATILSGYLHGELGFTGNAEDYYNHENSLLASVMDNRRGNPLTLSLLYRFVGCRAGLEIGGVNLPGHFIARCGETLIDPFNNGRVLQLTDCAEMMARQGRGLDDEHLEPPASRDVIARMLSNLGHAYSVEECAWQKRMVDRWIGILTGAERVNSE